MKKPGRALFIGIIAIGCFYYGGFFGYCADITRQDYYEDGTLRAIYPYNESGLLDGLAREYYPNGKIKVEAEYNNNVKEGTYKKYYENGNLIVLANYKDGKKDGILKRYYTSGSLMLEQSYLDGERDGPYKWYYRNEALKEEGTYEHDKKDGMSKRYFSTGMLKAERFYKDGQLISKTCYDEQGNATECFDKQIKK